VPYERECVEASARVHSGLVWAFPPSFSFELHVASLGPYRGLLELKRQGKPYREERFRVTGEVRARTTAHHLAGLTVTYLGRRGEEVRLAEWSPGLLQFPTEARVPVDAYLDVDTQWRGPGIQVVKVGGSTGWETDVDVYVNLCYELTWVG
jgi:hypothetical protein